jgi:hypothetical protein
MRTRRFWRQSFAELDSVARLCRDSGEPRSPSSYGHAGLDRLYTGRGMNELASFDLAHAPTPACMSAGQTSVVGECGAAALSAIP